MNKIKTGTMKAHYKLIDSIRRKTEMKLDYSIRAKLHKVKFINLWINYKSWHYGHVGACYEKFKATLQEIKNKNIDWNYDAMIKLCVRSRGNEIERPCDYKNTYHWQMPKDCSPF